MRESASAQNGHHPFYVVGQDVQRHFGADVLERFHLEVRGSHPRLYRAEGVLDSLAAYTHLVCVPIEPRLHRLEDSFDASDLVRKMVLAGLVRRAESRMATPKVAESLTRATSTYKERLLELFFRRRNKPGGWNGAAANDMIEIAPYEVGKFRNVVLRSP